MILMFSDTDLRETKGSRLMWVSICCDMSGAERVEGQGLAGHCLEVL